MHCESLISLLDIHVIGKRYGRIDNHIGNGKPTHHPLHRSITEPETRMYASAMNFLDRVTMTFVIVLGAAPVLAIFAQSL